MKVAFVQGADPPSLCDSKTPGQLWKQAVPCRTFVMICLIKLPWVQCLLFNSFTWPPPARACSPVPVLFAPADPETLNPWLPFPLGLQCPGSALSLHTGLAGLVITVGGQRVKPQRRPLGFCGFQPDPRCYFSATSVFNLRMCVDQQERLKHYYFFFPLAKWLNLKF